MCQSVTDQFYHSSLMMEGTAKLNEVAKSTVAGDEMPSSSPAIVSRMKLNDNKAGMEGLDRNKINKIIYEASKGSSFYKNELKKEEQVNRRIAEQQHQLNQLTSEQILQGEEEADRILAKLESERDLSRTIGHIDMDAFYAAVEMRDNPALRNKPMAVGGNSMLSTSNYLARRYGVRAAMPGFIGKKLCPDLVIVPTNFDKYTAVSKQVRAIIADYDPDFVPMSLDEAYFDITDHLQRRQTLSDEKRTFKVKRDSSLVCSCSGNQEQRGNQKHSVTSSEQSLNQLPPETPGGHVENHGMPNETSSSCEKECGSFRTEESDVDEANSALREAETLNRACSMCGKFLSSYGQRVFGTDVEETVNEMRARIEVKTQLTASAGIAPNTMLSKVCSDKNKPNGQYRIVPTKEDVMDFVNDLPIRKVSGIGKVSEKLLNALGVEKCSDLYHQRAILFHLYSRIAFMSFMEICLGLGSTRLESDGERKSMSVEQTFRELSKPPELYSKCQELCDSLAEDLRERGLKGKTITIKLKTVGFKQMTRAKSIAVYTNDSSAIYKTASELLMTEIKATNSLRLRLMGVRMSNFGTQDGKTEKGTIKDFFKTQNGDGKDVGNMCVTEPGTSSCAVNQLSTNKKSTITGFFKAASDTDVADTTHEDYVTDKNSSSHRTENSFQKLSANISSYSDTSSTIVPSSVVETVEPTENSASDGNGAVSPSHHGNLLCPVCSKIQPTSDLGTLNAHIDQCLSRGAIRELLESEQHVPRTDTSSFKRTKTITSSSQPPKKKKKTEGSARIDSYFK